MSTFAHALLVFAQWSPYCILHPVSCILHPASGIRHQASETAYSLQHELEKPVQEESADNTPVGNLAAQVVQFAASSSERKLVNNKQ